MASSTRATKSWYAVRKHKRLLFPNLRKKNSMVSVIIINYNTFNLTSNCIRSVYKHTTTTNFEIILVDNASTECDAELFKKEFPVITLIRNPENLGFAKGNNLGIKHAKGEYILLLNSDTELLNDAIGIALKTLQDDRKGAVSVKLQHPDGRVQCQCQRFPSVTVTLLETLRLHKLLPKKLRGRLLLGSYFKHDTYIEPDVVWGTFFMFKRKVLDSMPGKMLDEKYFMYYEDIQWCLDIKNAGYKIAYQPEGAVMHIIGQSNAPKNEMIKSNKKDFLKRNYSSIKVMLLGLLGY